MGEARVAWTVAGVHSRIVATDEIRARDLTGCLITLIYGYEQISIRENANELGKSWYSS